MSKFIDITGQTFGNLTVKSLSSEKTKDGRPKWTCECICGNTKDVVGKYLRGGEVTGCGCTLTRRMKAKPGELNPNWKGGKNNRGSLAWANHKLYHLNKTSKEQNYAEIVNDSAEDLIKILGDSKGACAICGRIEKDSQYERNHVDHCHSSGKIRGMLCSNCNTGLGSFMDSPELLLKAVEYLKNSATPGTPPALA